jgi:hypothetical protein
MKHARLLYYLFPFFIYACTSAKIASEKNGSKKWVRLFNGKNLDHWTPKISGYKAGENYNNTLAHTGTQRRIGGTQRLRQNRSSGYPL